ncbi:hypothetical protein AALP_AA3G021800 [Arabis alpina]|uniref:Uncharacterized protein n=1 Tax=Arabis alpina TaxID=50452 RepID=A0A087H6H7_ARAAL|nr:hypothetical protein AALP_AA3G021800 [Arabis alpina]
MVIDNWTKSAMRDGEVVAELLLRLKEAHVTPVFLTNPSMATLQWGIRQPRSRSTRYDGDSTKISRCSTNTPLSWNDDGYESTSYQIHGSKSTETGLVGIGAMFKENKKLKRIKDTNQIQEHHHHQDSPETSFLLPDLNMMPSQNDNLNHYFSPHVETLYGSIKIS